MSDRPSIPRNRQTLIVAAAVVGLLVVYGVFTGRVFAVVETVVYLVLLYLLYRFVRAHERIAAALETRDERRGDTGDE